MLRRCLDTSFFRFTLRKGARSRYGTGLVAEGFYILYVCQSGVTHQECFWCLKLGLIACVRLASGSLKLITTINPLAPFIAIRLNKMGLKLIQLGLLTTFLLFLTHLTSTVKSKPYWWNTKRIHCEVTSSPIPEPMHFDAVEVPTTPPSDPSIRGNPADGATSYWLFFQESRALKDRSQNHKIRSLATEIEKTLSHRPSLDVWKKWVQDNEILVQNFFRLAKEALRSNLDTEEKIWVLGIIASLENDLPENSVVVGKYLATDRWSEATSLEIKIATGESDCFIYLFCLESVVLFDF